MSKNNCAIYVRKSTEKGLEQEFNSLNNQEEACKNYILSQAFNNWKYYKTYEDGGISGGTMKRPGLQELIIDMKQGKIQTVVVYKVDRLSRSIMDFHNMMKEFDKYGCSFVSITQAFDTSNSMGKLTLNMLLSFAQFEREVSSERVRDKIRASKKKGLWTGGTPPLGYNIKDKKLVSNKAETETINDLFHKYLELKSISKLKQYTDEHNITSKQWTTAKGDSRGGYALSVSMLNRLLRNKICIGKIQNKKAGETYPGRHKAIIRRELFNEVQELLTEQYNRRTSVYLKDTYLLSGKIIDSNGNKFTNQKSSKHAVKKYRYYKQKGLYLPAGDIEKITLEVIKDFLDLDLNEIITKQKTLDFKSINWALLGQSEKAKLIKGMIDKIVYTENKLTYFIKSEEMAYLHKYKSDNYHNTDSKEVDKHIYQSTDTYHIIIEKEIYINNRTSTNRYEANGKHILTKSENSSHLIKAISYAWRYKKMYEQGLSIQNIRDNEHKSIRSIYQYLTLSYLSPNIISNILDSNIPEKINLQTLLSISTEPDFIKQEKLFYE
jgi:DNA invertase Pin-like site-specific DNA recombinase